MMSKLLIISEASVIIIFVLNCKTLPAFKIASNLHPVSVINPADIYGGGYNLITRGDLSLAWRWLMST